MQESAAAAEAVRQLGTKRSRLKFDLKPNPKVETLSPLNKKGNGTCLLKVAALVDMAWLWRTQCCYHVLTVCFLHVRTRNRPVQVVQEVMGRGRAGQ